MVDTDPWRDRAVDVAIIVAPLPRHPAAVTSLSPWRTSHRTRPRWCPPRLGVDQPPALTCLFIVSVSRQAGREGSREKFEVAAGVASICGRAISHCPFPIVHVLPSRPVTREEVHERDGDQRHILGGRVPAAVHARAGRRAGRLHPRHHGQSRWFRLGQRWGHLCQRVLRPERFPHHAAPHEGVGAFGDHSAARLLGPACPPAAAGTLRAPRGHRALHRLLRAGWHSVDSARRRSQHACSTSATGTRSSPVRATSRRCRPSPPSCTRGRCRSRSSSISCGRSSPSSSSSCLGRPEFSSS